MSRGHVIKKRNSVLKYLKQKRLMYINAEIYVKKLLHSKLPFRLFKLSDNGTISCSLFRSLVMWRQITNAAFGIETTFMSNFTVGRFLWKVNSSWPKVGYFGLICTVPSWRSRRGTSELQIHFDFFRKKIIVTQAHERECFSSTLSCLHHPN